MTFIPYLLIIFSTALWADPNRIESNYDTNNDSKIDYVEITVDKLLVEKKEDLNFDGVFDLRTTFPSDSEYSKIIEQRSYANEPRKRISYWNDLVLKKSFSLTQIDENNDGKWDKEFKTSTELNQLKEDCGPQLPEHGIAGLISGVIGVVVKADEFVETAWGYKIQKTCLDIGKRDWFLNNTKKSITEGLACLKKLGSKGGRGAAKNFIALTNLLKEKKVQIICTELGYDWTGTLAHATATASDSKPHLSHPGISFNPMAASKNEKDGKAGANSFIKTLFHEQLHNLGTLHGHDIEYSYGCETCCFPEREDSRELKAASCKICSGNYTGVLDLNYIKDISDFAQASYRANEARDVNISYLKVNPGNVTGMSYLAMNLSSVFNPIGSHLAEKVKSSGGVSADDGKVLEKAQKYNDEPGLMKYDRAAKVIADAFYSSYTGHPDVAMKLLERESAMIKEQLAQADDSTNAEYIKGDLKTGLQTLINDVWLNHHVGSSKDEKQKKELDDLGYKLHTEYGL